METEAARVRLPPSTGTGKTAAGDECRCTCHNRGEYVLHFAACCDRTGETFFDENGNPFTD